MEQVSGGAAHTAAGIRDVEAMPQSGRADGDLPVLVTRVEVIADADHPCTRCSTQSWTKLY